MRLEEAVERFHKAMKELMLEEFPVNGFNIYIDFPETEINSIGFVKAVIQLEQEFGIEFDDDKLSIKQFQNIEALLKYIIDKVEEAKQAGSLEQ